MNKLLILMGVVAIALSGCGKGWTHVDGANTIKIDGKNCFIADIHSARSVIKPGITYCPVGELTTVPVGMK